MSTFVTDFQSQVIDASKHLPIVVEFGAEWCSPCKAFSPTLQLVSLENTERWNLVYVDIDQHTELVKALRVLNVPTVAVVYLEKILASFSGLLYEKELREWLQKYIPDTRDKSGIKNALEVWSSGEMPEEIIINQSKAIELLIQHLNLYPDDIWANGLFALWSVLEQPEASLDKIKWIEDKLRIESPPPNIYEIIKVTKLLAEIFDIIRGTDKLPEVPAKQHYLNALNALRNKKYEICIREFIDTIIKDREFDKGNAKNICIAVFQFLSPDHPISKKYRRIFDMSLY